MLHIAARTAIDGGQGAEAPYALSSPAMPERKARTVLSRRFPAIRRCRRGSSTEAEAVADLAALAIRVTLCMAGGSS
jgi:hypothetical protein